jgi:hypothetical protein
MRPLLVGGNLIIEVAFVNYRPGGVLDYDELLVSVLSLQRGRPRHTIVGIWVDSPASRAGGRELWAIPKELAAFGRTSTGTTIRSWMTTDPDPFGAGKNQPVAELIAHPGRRLLPGTPQLPLVVAQRLDGRTVVSRNRIVAAVRHLRAVWRFRPDGPLGYLAGARPLFSAALTDASVTVGAPVLRS